MHEGLSLRNVTIIQYLSCIVGYYFEILEEIFKNESQNVVIGHPVNCDLISALLSIVNVKDFRFQPENSGSHQFRFSSQRLV